MSIYSHSRSSRNPYISLLGGIQDFWNLQSYSSAGRVIFVHDWLRSHNLLYQESRLCLSAYCSGKRQIRACLVTVSFNNVELVVGIGSPKSSNGSPGIHHGRQLPFVLFLAPRLDVVSHRVRDNGDRLAI